MRKIIQIAFDVGISSEYQEYRETTFIDGSSTLTALCDDGSVWSLSSNGKEWVWKAWDLPPIPQDVLDPLDAT